MFSSLLVVVSFSIAAPAIKDPPKKETPSIVGEWEGVEAVRGGQAAPVPPGGVTMQFTADNKVIISEGKRAKNEQASYKVDFTKTPMEIDLVPPAKLPNEKPLLGILKFEEDKVIICFSGGGDSRPTKFETAAGSNEMLMTLKRKKEK